MTHTHEQFTNARERLQVRQILLRKQVFPELAGFFAMLVPKVLARKRLYQLLRPFPDLVPDLVERNVETEMPEGLLPCCRVLIYGVDQSSIDIEQNCVDSFHGAVVRGRCTYTACPTLLGNSSFRMPPRS